MAEDELFAAARSGDAARLATLLDADPTRLDARAEPFGFTLLHAGAKHFAVVDLLLSRGLDPNLREVGDNTTAMHWAAAAGELDVVRRLADAGGDIVGRGDDHDLEVIGWATCWDGGDDDRNRAVVRFLLERGAKHHIFSAIATDDDAEVRRIVSANPGALNRRLTRNENHQLPLQFAIRMRRPRMVSLLIELGADPLGMDGSGMPAAIYAVTPEIDRPVMRAIAAMTTSELDSAERGHRPPRVGTMDLLAALALGDERGAEHLLGLLQSGGRFPPGALHVMAKRGDISAVRWLLDHGADPNARWAHWDAEVTPLHLAVLGNHADVCRVLLQAGADAAIPDSKHDSSPLGWAEFFGRPELVEMLSAFRKQ